MNRRSEKAGAQGWPSILEGVAAALLRLGSWAELETHERTHIEGEVKAQADYPRGELTETIEPGAPILAGTVAGGACAVEEIAKRKRAKRGVA